METIDTTTGSVPPPAAPAPVPAPETPPETPAETPAPAPETPKKNKGGRPKGSKTKKRHTRAPREAADPLGDVPRDVAEKPATPAEVVAEEPAASAEPPKQKLGPEKAAALFETCCVLYDAIAPQAVTRLLGNKIAAGFQTDAKRREVWAACVEVAKLSANDREILQPPIVLRLAELDVSPEADLWMALATVFGMKFWLISSLADPAKAEANAGVLSMVLAKPAEPAANA